jgi:cation:H+ antiporter
MRAPIGFGLLAVAAVLLTIGAELFAEHAADASRRLGVTALAIGLVLAGAEPEELVTAVFASGQHHPGIAAGDAIGANVTMLTIVLGLAALIRPFRTSARAVSYAVIAAVVGIAAAVALLLGGGPGRPAGAVLVAMYLAVVGLIWRRERRPPAFGEAAELAEDDERAEDDEAVGTIRASADEAAGTSTPEAGGRRGTRAVLLMAAGLVLMIAGGRLAVSGAERIVGSLGLRESVVGLTFVSLATTAELFALVWAAARRGVEELALAGVLGSAIYNSTATLGAAALVRPLTGTGIAWQAWLAAALPAAFAAWAIAFKRIGRPAGVLLVLVYAGYLAFTFG